MQQLLTMVKLKLTKIHYIIIDNFIGGIDLTTIEWTCIEYTNETACNAVPNNECFWESRECFPSNCSTANPCPVSFPYCSCADIADKWTCTCELDSSPASAANATTVAATAGGLYISSLESASQNRTALSDD